MKLPRLEVLSSDEIIQIHNASMEILEDVGVKIDVGEAREILKKAGAEVNEESHMVKMPEYMVKEALNKAPSQFVLYGREEKFKLRVGGDTLTFTFSPTPVKIIDSETGKVRETTLKDVENKYRLIDALKYINTSHTDVWAHDVPFTTIHAYEILTWAKNTIKCFGIGPYGVMASQDVINMVSMVAGGEEELIKKPRIIGFYNPVSPLQTSDIVMRGMMIFNRYKQPMIIAPEAQAGATAPSTLAGLLVQQNAEILSSLVLCELVSPGTPVLYGTVSTITDMRTGNIALGSIETGLIYAASAQLAKFYRLPSRALAGTSETMLVDIQAGFEKALTLFMAAAARINYITCAGTIESSITTNMELIMIDEELIGMIRRSLEGIEVNENTLAVDVIKEVGAGGSYLSHKHTLRNFQKEQYIPFLIDRSKREVWEKRGSKSIIDVAREKWQKILKEHQPEPLDKSVEKNLLDYLEMVKKRTIDDYFKAEGIERRPTGLPNLP
ncbi:MAG: trimethylamine methyltransferase family protein [Candidatus Freyarchaeota archaeon]